MSGGESDTSAALVVAAAVTAGIGASDASSTKQRKGSEWEILGDLDRGVQYQVKPKKQEGFLSKRRKWPLKGWHKRYFVLDNGVLTYGKNPGDIARGRTYGRINVGVAVVSAKTELFRIDIDEEACIHHLKLTNEETFMIWLEKLKQHRLYQQYLMNTASPDDLNLPEPVNLGSPRGGSLPRGIRPALAHHAWSREFSALDEHMTSQLLNIQQQAVSLALLAQRAEDEQNASLGGAPGSKHKKLFGLRKKKSAAVKTTSGSGSGVSGVSGGGESRSSTLTNNGAEEGMGSSSSSSTLATMVSLSSSNPSLPTSSSPAGSFPAFAGGTFAASGSFAAAQQQQAAVGGGRPVSLPAADAAATPNKGQKLSSLAAPPPSVQLQTETREEMLALAQDIQVDVSNLMRSFANDLDRLRTCLEQLEQQSTKSGTLGPGSNVAVIASLRQALNQAMQQNSMLRARLQKIHLDSDVGDLPLVSTANVDTLSRGMNHSLSYSSSCISEFFDAREYTDHQEAEFSDDSSEDEVGASDSESTTDDDQHYEEATSGPPSSNVVAVAGESSASGSSGAPELRAMTGRRQKLPIPKADTEGINLWNLLCKNIGKDLSKISMPVTLNEPLSALQRLCEELEYSELLDKAAAARDSQLERMTWVAAFAISIYGSCQARAGHKPFNPLLGETFECVREDRGFRYVAEQVSHHPPVSACHATSSNGKWTWEQDIRVKTKFWGKSMEFQPEGLVRLNLQREDGRNETYEWNKITTCIHNLFGGADRWVDLYGQCVIKGPKLTCKIDFVKASYWSNKRHEIFGTIMGEDGQVLQHLFGKWSEALYCGKAPSARVIWRPAMLPADSELYYGFSRFAVELNELLDNEQRLLPASDTRFRPDQRLLEQGKIPEAENMKLRLEQSQRDRRREIEEGRRREHQALWFSPSKGQWQFTGDYWKIRKNQGFDACNQIPKLW